MQGSAFWYTILYCNYFEWNLCIGIWWQSNRGACGLEAAAENRRGRPDLSSGQIPPLSLGRCCLRVALRSGSWSAWRWLQQQSEWVREPGMSSSLAWSPPFLPLPLFLHGPFPQSIQRWRWLSEGEARPDRDGIQSQRSPSQNHFWSFAELGPGLKSGPVNPAEILGPMSSPSFSAGWPRDGKWGWAWAVRWWYWILSQSTISLQDRQTIALAKVKKQ